MQNFPSPRLHAYLALLKDFQRALLPKPSSLVRSINQAPSTDPDCFQFALGTSSHGTLSRAVVECVQQVKQKLGPDRSPDLCQLFVTADTYGSNNIRFASAVSATVHTCYVVGIRPSALYYPPAHSWLIVDITQTHVNAFH